MGVVTDFLPPARSRGKDWTCNFRLADDTTYDDGVKVQFFRPMETDLPQVQCNGDVLILHMIKITSWKSMITGLSTRSTLWTIIPAASIPQTPPPGQIYLQCMKANGSSPPTQEQMRYAIELCSSRDRSTYGTSPVAFKQSSTDPTQTPSGSAPTSSSIVRRDKFALIKDVQVEKYYDLVVQVVKIYPSNGVVELYVTDYTTNHSLFNYAWGHDDDEYSEKPKWRGPLGKQTLTVSLFPPHSYHAQNSVGEDDYVFLRNTRIKTSKDGGKMEGSLHTDKYYPDRVDITVLKDHTDDRMKDLLRRKREYTTKWSRQIDGYAEITQGQKRKAKEEPKLSKKARKRRKQQSEQEALKQKQRPIPSDDEEKTGQNVDPFKVHIIPNVNGDTYHHGKYSTPSTSPQPKPDPQKPTSLNKYVRASYPEYPTRALSSILSHSIHTTPTGTQFALPFQNVKSRACVRVVDFAPHNLADFAVRKRKPSEYDVLSDQEGDSSSNEEDNIILPPDTDAEDNGSQSSGLIARDDDDGIRDRTSGNQQWEWRFSLILEDASVPARTAKQENDRMPVYLAGADAECLLKLDGCDLRRTPQRLAALREKLFLLWGDLEERIDDIVHDGFREQEEGKRKGRPGSMPFECCIKEYGIRSRDGADGSISEESHQEKWGWDRKFRMFGTTIL